MPDPTEARKRLMEPMPDEQAAEEWAEAWRLARLRVRHLVRREREGERVTSKLLNLRFL